MADSLAVFAATIAAVGAIVWLYMTLWFALALALRRNDIADIAWGLGFVLIAWWLLLLRASGGGTVPRRLWLVFALVTVWGIRLAVHIGRRYVGHPEDPRYAAWRASWGRWFVVRSYLQVFMLQGAFMVITALPIIAVGSDTGTRAWPSTGELTVVVGAAVWLAGFWLEVAGDAQLTRYLAEPENRGKPLERGLWRLSRHPNYFGEALLWWGIWLVSLGTPGGIVAVLGPLTITVLLRYVSGVPMLERRHLDDPAWQKYRSRTSVFVPRRPRAR